MKTRNFFYCLNFFKADIFRLSATLCLLLFSSYIKAGDELFLKRINGSAVAMNATADIKDNLFYKNGSATWIADNHIRYQSVTNRIILKVDTSIVYDNYYSCSLGLEVKFKDKNNVQKTLKPTLTVEYRNGTTATETDQFIYQFYGGHDVTVKITSTLVNGSSTASVPTNLILENNIHVKRFYEFDAAASPGGLTITPKNGGRELELQWPSINGAEEYQLEWMFVNDYNGTSLTGNRSAADIDYDFKDNGTRVSVPSSVLSYTINNLFEKGYIVFRHRGVGRTGAGNKISLEGKWSCDACKGKMNDPSLKYYQTTAHEKDSLNWFYTAAYAEEGKRKEAINYMDGINKNRQSVSKLNTDNLTIVGETIYDKEGRPAVSVMPVPSGIGTIMYNKNFNRNLDGNDYSSPDFENNSNPCVNAAAELSRNSGAARYFSPLNPDLRGMQAYVPDAEGYPISQIEYTPDNTGRVKRSGAVGDTFQLNSGHEVIHYYGKPLQEQLDKLFGSEAGHYSHYKKNMVRDANGQLTVSYLDMFGRTVATALAGEGPQSLDHIYPAGTLDETEVNILDNKPVIKGDMSLRSQFVYLANTVGTHEFTYEMKAPLYSDETCLDEENICYECVYDLEISVKDECGVELLPGAEPIRKTIGLLNDYVCDEKVSHASSFDVDFDKTGTYYISKTLTVNKDALTKGLAHYTRTKNCVKRYKDFIKEEREKIDYSSCESVNKCDDVCLEELGTKEKYLEDNPGLNERDYLSALLACHLECASPPLRDALYKQLLSDMSPGGQYAEYTTDENGDPLSAKDNTSILHHDNVFEVDISDPSIEFKDENGEDAKVILANGDEVTPNELFASSVTEFITHWKRSWAEALVKYHPEYAYYQVGLAFDRADLYEMLILNTDNYADALKHGIMNPLELPLEPPVVPVPKPNNSDNYPLPFSPPNSGLPYMDPFFSDFGHLYRDRMIDYVKNVELNKNGTIIKGLWQVAVANTICNGLTPAACATSCSSYVFTPAASLDPCTADNVWKNFRALYLSKRTDYLDSLIENKLDEFGGTTNKDIGVTGIFASKKKVYMWAERDLKQKYGDDVFSTDPADIANSQNLSQVEIDEQCNSQCTEYAAYWMNELRRCNSAPAKWNDTNPIYVELRDKLIAVCKLGCDSDHPMGSSTVANGSDGVPSGRPGVLNYKSFSDVMKGIFGTETIECGSDLLSMPVPYNNTSLTSQSYMDTCACDKILYTDWYYNFLAGSHTLPAGMTKQKLFEQIYGVKPDDLNGKICLCNSALAESGVTVWSPNVNWSMASINKLLASKRIVSPALTCPTCTKCDQVKSLANAYKTQVELVLGGPVPEEKLWLYEKSLAKHLNDELNFSFGILDYNNFMRECDKATEGGFSCVAGPAAKDLEKLLNLLVLEDRLLTWDELCKKPYTATTIIDRVKNGNFSYTDLLASKVDPTFVSGDCGHIYCFNDTTDNTLFASIKKESNILCQLELKFIKPGFDFADIQSFSNLYIDAKNAGNNYHFFIRADVEVDGEIVYAYLSGKTTCIPLGECSNNNDLLTLCSTPEDVTENCAEELEEDAVANGAILYKNYINRVKNEFVTRYVDKCLNSVDDEEFKMLFRDGEYHYTLYYYNQAGNLVRTVPPEGIELLSDNEVRQVSNDRKANVRSVFTKHRMATTYKYNSLDQVIEQSVPDHDQFNEWMTYSSTHNLPPNLNATKAQQSGEKGTYMIAVDPDDASKSLIYYAEDGVSWQLVNDIGLSNLSAVHYIGSTGYIVGDKGILLKTTDGNTWSLTSSGINEDLKAIYFSSASNGIIITKSVKVYKTTNAGTSWELVVGSGLELDELNELTFVNASKGIAVGRKGVAGAIFYSNDGGLSWFPANSFTSTDLKSVQLLPDNTTAYAAGVAGTLVKSSNGGQDWLEVNTNLTNDFKEIFFTNELFGAALGEDGKLYSTNSGGNVWTKIKEPNNDDAYVDIHFINTVTGYALSREGELLITNSGGAAWKWVHTIGTPTNMTTIFFDNTGTAYAGGENGKLYRIEIYQSNYSSESVSTGLSETFKSLHFKEDIGSAILSNGTLMRTTNGGDDWHNATPNAYAYNSFSYYTQELAVAISPSGKVAYTVNAGQVWTPTNDLPAGVVGSSVFVSNTGKAVIVGNAGGILNSTNYGGSWNNNTQNVKPLVLKGGVMKSTGIGYVVGEGGSLYRTFDGGINWKNIPTNTTVTLRDVNETNSNIILAGDGGIISVSNNIVPVVPAWERKDVPVAKGQHQRIAVAGPKGYITSSDGKILTSSDYGVSWSVYHPGTFALGGLHLISELVGYAVGKNGTIIKITPAPPIVLSNATRPAKLNDTHCEGNYAVAVGTGVILRSEDGGRSWANSVATPSHVMRAVGFVKPESGSVPSTILVVGNGLVLRSIDGGILFTPINGTAITGANMAAISVINEEWAYAVGDNGVIRRTDDGGLTWEIVNSPVSVDLTSVTIKGKVGFITGKNGTILRSMNVFASDPDWKSLKAPNTEDWVKYLTHLTPSPALNSVYFHDFTTGYVAGEKGVVLKTKNGGNSWEKLAIEGIPDLNYIAFFSQAEGIILGKGTTVLTARDERDNISTMFFYDCLGRLVASQNTKQNLMEQDRFSYTRYDEQNRVIETGEFATNYNNLNTQTINTPNFPDNISQGKYNVVKTYYDKSLNSEIEGFFGAGGQQNLRSRVATVTIQEVFDPSKIYDHATHYSYDIHGNVKSVVQDNPEID